MPTKDNIITFHKGKMNRDNDPRVIQDGEYIRLQNGRIARSEGDGVGSLENVLGNEAVASFVDNNAVVLGSVRDISEDRIYYFIKGEEEDAVYEYNEITEIAIPLLRDDRGILNFDANHLINGARIIGASDVDDDIEELPENIRSQKLLIWTDNLNPPRKINVNRVRARFNGEINQFTESEISLEKSPPLFAPQTSEIHLNIDSATEPINIIDSFLSDEDLDLSEERKRELVELLLTELELEENLKEKFPRFAYRYRYEDNEYSAFSPFSPAMFRPGLFNFDQDTGAITGMENQMKAIQVSFNTGGSDVIEIELLYKDTSSNTVYVIESYNKADRNWGDNVDLSGLNDTERPINFSSQKLYRALPSDQLERVYDNVPIRAKTLEVVDNRIMFGNYVDKYDLLDVRKEYNERGVLRNTYEDEIIVDFEARRSQPEEVGQNGDDIKAGVGERSLKSDRDYELGIVYLDNLGRQTPVLTSADNSVRVPINRANKINKLSVDIKSKAPEFATHYRFFVKDTRAAVHHNVIPLESQLQPDDDAFRWFRLAETDQGKIAEGDHLNLKVNMGTFHYDDEANVQKVQVRVEEISIKGRNFLEVNEPRTGRVEKTDEEGNLESVIEEGEIYTAQQPGLWMKVKNISLFPDDVEQPASSSRGNARSNNARNSNFKPIKGINDSQPDWKDFTYYYAGGNVTSEDEISEDWVTFSDGTTWMPGSGLTTNSELETLAPEYGPVPTDAKSGYGPMRVEIEILEDQEFRCSWWLSPSEGEPAVVKRTGTASLVDGSGDLITSHPLINGITLTLNESLEDYKIGDRWVTTYRTPTNFMWRCWRKSGGAKANRYAGPNDSERYAFNARRAHVMLYGPGVLEGGINGNSMIQFGIRDGLEGRLDGNPITLPYSRNTYYTEDVYYPTLEEWMFEEGYWSSGGQERLHGTDRDGTNVGIHQFGFYRGVPVTPDAEFSGIERALSRILGAGGAIGSSEVFSARNLLKLGLGFFLTGGTSIVASLLASLVGGKTTKEYWRLQSDDPSKLLFEDAEGNDAAPLYAFVQSGTYNNGRNNQKAERRQTSEFSFFQGNGAGENEIQMMNLCFETIPEESELDVYYEIGDTFTCLNGVHFGNEISNGQKITYLDPQGNETLSSFSVVDGNQVAHTETKKVSQITINLDHFNCFAWNNGVEVKSIRDEIGTPALDAGAKASTVVENYEESNNFASILFSERFNAQAGVNGLNEFSSTKVALGTIRKELDELDGSIQRFFSRDTDLVVFQEDKVTKVLVNKDAWSGGDGTQNVISSQNVLGQTIPFAGEYGISTNPESFAVYGNRMYFSDSNRGVICRLGQSGIEEISNFGMRDFFREELRHNYGTIENPVKPIVVGSYDDYHDQYLVSIREPLQDPSFPRNNLSLLLSKQAFLSRTDACRYPEDDLQYTQVYEFYTKSEPEGFQLGDLVFYNQERTRIFNGDNDWFVWFDEVGDVDYDTISEIATVDNVVTQTFRHNDILREFTPPVGQEVTIGVRSLTDEDTGLAVGQELTAFVTRVQDGDITVRYQTAPTTAILSGQEVEFGASVKYVINIDNFGVVRAKENCEGVIPPNHDAMRISIASYTSPEEACAKGLVARIIYHDGDDASADVGDSIYDTPYGTDEFIDGDYSKGRTQKRGWYQMFDGTDLEDYVINIIQGKVVEKIRCAEIAAGRKRVLTTMNPIQRKAGEDDDRLATRVCAIVPAEVSFHDGEGDSPEIGDLIFQDGFTNSPLVPGYYALEGGYYIRVADGGLVTEKRLCAITICADDVVEAQLVKAQNRPVNNWTFCGVGGDTRDLPSVLATTPQLGDPGVISLNGAITSFGEFIELQYDWYLLRDEGFEPTERQVIDRGNIVLGGIANRVGAVTNVEVSDLQAFTTYYALFVVDLGSTQITSDVLPVQLQRSTVPTVTLARTDSNGDDIGDTVTLTTSVMADESDTWTQEWYATVDGSTTLIALSDADEVGPFTATAAETDTGGVYTLTIAALPGGIRTASYFSRCIFTGISVDTNTVSVTRTEDTNRYSAASFDVDDTITTPALTADPSLDDTFPMLSIDGVSTTVFSIVSGYGDGVPADDYATSEVLSTDTFDQTATYTLPVYTDQVETLQSQECISEDGCTLQPDGVTALSSSLAKGENYTSYIVTTEASVVGGSETDATRNVGGSAQANLYDGGSEVAGTRTGGVTSHGSTSCGTYSPSSNSCHTGSVTQTASCSTPYSTTAIYADILYTCISVDALDGTTGCPDQGESYVVNEQVVAAASGSTPSTDSQTVPCTGIPPVDGTASFAAAENVGDPIPGTFSHYTQNPPTTVDTETAADSVEQVTQTTTYSSVTVHYTGCTQQRRQLCEEDTAPSGGGSPGTCPGGVAIGNYGSASSISVDCTDSESPSISNGGVIEQEVANPAYTTSWNCDGAGNCSEVAGSGGTYSSESACNTGCTPPAATMWSFDGCFLGNAVCVEDPSGIYSSQSACETDGQVFCTGFGP